MNINLIVQTRHDFGLKTILEIAEEYEIPKSGLFYHIQAGHLPQPSTTIDNKPRKYYKAEEVEIIKDFYAKELNHKSNRDAVLAN